MSLHPIKKDPYERAFAATPEELGAAAVAAATSNVEPKHTPRAPHFADAMSDHTIACDVAWATFTAKFGNQEKRSSASECGCGADKNGLPPRLRHERDEEMKSTRCDHLERYGKLHCQRPRSCAHHSSCPCKEMPLDNGKCPKCRGAGGFMAGHNSFDSINCFGCGGDGTYASWKSRLFND